MLRSRHGSDSSRVFVRFGTSVAGAIASIHPLMPNAVTMAPAASTDLSIEPKPKTRDVHRTSNTIAHEQNSLTFHTNTFFPSYLLMQADDYYPHQHPCFYFIRDMFTNELQEQEENRYTIYMDK
jgi:hypothetical protein